jgi:hypothetical protein
MRLRTGRWDFASGRVATDFDADLPDFANVLAAGLAFPFGTAFNFRAGTALFVTDFAGFFAAGLAAARLPEDFDFVPARRRFDAAGLFGAAFFFAMLGLPRLGFLIQPFRQ